MNHNKKRSFEEFCKIANEKHNFKYEYDEKSYYEKGGRVKAKCPIHGWFEQEIYSHLKGFGCRLCASELRGRKRAKKLEDFIKDAEKHHGKTYIYDKVDYIDANTEVCIICPIHGEFWQTPSNHTHKTHPRGCPKCNGGLILTLSEFIERAIKVHGKKYDYSEVVYKGYSKKIRVICPIHGVFIQTVSNHLRGYGCPKCSHRNTLYTIDEFIEMARKIHGGKYDYSKVVYLGNKIKICIICPIHGEFWQTPSSHLKGCGCPSCNESKLERNIAKLLSENDISFERQKRFEWLGKQSLDFYLPKYNIAIECQGEQHFKPIDFANKGEEWALKELEIIKELDERKKNLCYDNNLRLIYFSILEKNGMFTNELKLIEEILKHDDRLSTNTN